MKRHSTTDFFGTPLNVGDQVVCAEPGGRKIVRAVVAEIFSVPFSLPTPQQVRIAYHNNSTHEMVNSKNLIKYGEIQDA